jgi:hypothetical protein
MAKVAPAASTWCFFVVCFWMVLDTYTILYGMFYHQFLVDLKNNSNKKNMKRSLNDRNNGTMWSSEKDTKGV